MDRKHYNQVNWRRKARHKEPIEWQPYTGETITVNTILRKGKKIIEKGYYEDRVKAVPSGNAYIIGNGPSRKDFDLTTLKATGQTRFQELRTGCGSILTYFTRLCLMPTNLTLGIPNVNILFDWFVGEGLKKI